jgi:hypothetical protein
MKVGLGLSPEERPDKVKVFLVPAGMNLGDEVREIASMLYD